MKFSSWAELINMQGHGVYVWSSYGLFFVAFASLIGFSVYQHRRWLAQQRRQLKRQSQRAVSVTVKQE